MRNIIGNWFMERGQRAVEQAPDDPRAWAKLYGLYVEHQDAAGFLTCCRGLIRRHPSSQAAWKFLRLAGEGLVSETEELSFIRDIIRQHPESERAWSQLDMAIDRHDDKTEWIGFCREIVNQHSNNRHAWSRLMRELKHEAKHADLVSACLQAIKHKPDAQTWVNLAEAYAAQCRFDEAITAYEKALELKPDYLVALNGLGCVYHTQGRVEEAIIFYERATKLRKDDATPWVWLALAYMQTAQLQKARDAISKVKASLPLVAQMLTEELSTLPDDCKVADPRVPVSRFAFPNPT